VRWDAAVPDYDAFGREIGEDPLKRLRENTNPAPAETPRAEVAPPEPETEAWSGAHEPEPVVATPEPEAERVFVAPPEFVRPRRRARGVGLAGLLVLVAGIAAIGLVANSAVDKGEELIDGITNTLPDAEPDAPPPVGLEADSLIRRDNYAAALDTLEESGLGRPTLLRIAPERIDAQLLDGNTIHVVQITPDGELREFASSQGTGRPLAYKSLDVGAPERLVRRGATAKTPPRNINYLVVSPGPPQTVGAYFKNGRIVIGDAHGRPQRVL
jgi:hypothetical protein